MVREYAYAALWLVVGLLAAWSGRWFMRRVSLVMAAVTAATVPSSLGLMTDDRLAVAMATIGSLMVPWQLPLFGRLILTFPSGRLDTRAVRLLITAAFAVAAAESLLVLWTGLPYHPRDCEGCAPGMDLGGPASAAQGISRVLAIGWLLLGTSALVVAVQRYRTASGRRRTLLRGHYVATVLSLVTLVGFSAYAVVVGSGPLSQSAAFIALAQALALLGVPLSLVVGMLRDQAARARLVDLVQRSSRDGHDLRTSLAEALRDPDLVLAVRGDGCWVDLAGVPVEVRSDRTRSITLVRDGSGAELAAVVHDVSLDDEPQLLLAAGSATRMVLEHEVMRARLAQRTRELRASRARVVQATDDARRRMERDLHDGAQQYLVAAGMALQLGRMEVVPSARQHIDEAAALIKVALQSLRDLANGLYPANLAERGLDSALRTMAARMPFPVEITGEVPHDLPLDVRNAVFFSVAEAVANALKHAGASSMRIDVHHTSSALKVEVRDDGCGGVPSDDTALASISDRVASVNGRMGVDSSPGGGTCVRIEVPCVP